MITWPWPLVLIEGTIPKRATDFAAGTGKDAADLFLQQWFRFNLSDPPAKEAIYDSESLLRFARVDLGA